MLHEPHDLHCPDHCSCCSPHSRHTYACLTLLPAEVAAERHSTSGAVKGAKAALPARNGAEGAGKFATGDQPRSETMLESCRARAAPERHKRPAIATVAALLAAAGTCITSTMM